MKNVFPKTISGALDVDSYLTVKNLIWNPDTLSWQAATGGSSGSDVNVTNFPAVQPVSDTVPYTLWLPTATTATTISGQLIYTQG